MQAELGKRGWDASCYFAMRYWNPMTEEVGHYVGDGNAVSMLMVHVTPLR